MGNSLRCCLACVLPCGSLDLIRIIHLNGTVEEITHSVTAGEILKDNPNHVLAKPFSQEGIGREILVLSPDSELKRGSIYFLIPDSSLPASENKNNLKVKKKTNNDNLESRDQHRHSEKKKNTKSREDHRRRKARPVEWHPYLDSILEEL
ncbi:uncharacterized protein LOC124921166 [Impatiens glandulifera]|uniref:uncharacterized protein LOC124921166 n=1 Tax=Impatiens glandulifera TaxID=253017 RepID=UPI001FB0A0A9|nr:uncharacterized protein LOC124921166 [Impatiens glandulifera]